MRSEEERRPRLRCVAERRDQIHERNRTARRLVGERLAMHAPAEPFQLGGDVVARALDFR
jgi:hypothetical protein